MRLVSDSIQEENSVVSSEQRFRTYTNCIKRTSDHLYWHGNKLTC